MSYFDAIRAPESSKSVRLRSDMRVREISGCSCLRAANANRHMSRFRKIKICGWVIGGPFLPKIAEPLDELRGIVLVESNIGEVRLE